MAFCSSARSEAQSFWEKPRMGSWAASVASGSDQKARNRFHMFLEAILLFTFRI